MSKLRLKTVLGNLVLVQPDVRMVGASGIYAFPGGKNSRAGVFARSVFQRYGHGVGRGQRLERIFRLFRFLQNTSSEHRSLSQVINRHIRPSVNVRACFDLKRVVINPGLIPNQFTRNETPRGKLISIATQTIKKVVQSNDRVKTPTVSGERRTLLRLIHAQSIVQRVTKRNVRIEENRSQRNIQRTFSSPKTQYLKPAPPVTQKVRRSVKELPNDLPEPGRLFSDPPEPSNRSIMHRNHNDNERMVPVNVNRLTEQVVRAIDQRIIARRERLGRI